jgi:hypothetical protein
LIRSASRSVTAAVAALVLLGSACGGSKTPTAAEDEETARRIVLTSADLPGFSQEPAVDDNGTAPMDRCVNDNPLLVGENPRGVDSADFTKDDGNLRVQSGAVLAVKPAEAAKAFTDLTAALSSECLKDAIRDTFTSGAERGVVVRDVSSSPLPKPDVPAESAASRLAVSLERGRERTTVHVDMTALRSGRVVGGVFTFSMAKPFPDDERIRLTRLVADRMRGKAKNTPDTGPVATTPSSVVAPPTTVGAATYARFRDPSGVSLEHPRSWTVEPSSTDVPLHLLLDPPGGVPFRRNVNIVAQTSARPITLAEYTELSLRQIRELRGSTISDSRPTTLAGLPAHRITYRADFGSGEQQVLSVWTMKNNRIWLVTYSADPARYSSALPEVERLFGTIQLPA